MTNIEAAKSVDQSLVGAFWMVYHRAHLLFEQGAPKKFVYNECVVFRDILLLNTGSVMLPETAEGESQLSVAYAVTVAHGHYRHLQAKVVKRNKK
ncbi:MAG TPA: hypothetical protein VJP02_16625 [Candidatus Sulfotelmatobacter sp.]|nr:hypothetical protein [Candidatus Sulfotelmatobacter sp.]